MIYNDYRPHRFDDVKGQEFVVENIRNQSKKGRFFPVFILCGQYGSGKTTMARLIAMAANCTHKDENGNPCGECDACKAVLNHAPEGIIEIDGASNNGVEDIRKLLANAGTLGMFEKKVIVIDEAHMLSKSAFNALLITLENPPEHCIFILCTTEKDALPETVVSRAPVYTFGKIADSVVREHVLEVAGKSGILISKDAAGLIARYANGAMRNALQILEHLSLQKDDGEEITDQDVISILGLSSIEQRADFLDACIRADIGKVNGILKECESTGVSLATFLADSLSMATDLLLYLAKSEVIGSTYYMESLARLSGYGELVAGKLCRLFSRLSSRGNRYLTTEQVVMEVMSAFRAIKEDDANVVYVSTPAVQTKVSDQKQTNVQAEVSPEQQKDAVKIEVEESEEAEESKIPEEKPQEVEGFNATEDVPFEEEPKEKPVGDAFSQFDSMFGGFGFGMVSAGTQKSKKKAAASGAGNVDLMAAGSPAGKGKEKPEDDLEAETGQVSLCESEDEDPSADSSVEKTLEGEADAPEAPETEKNCKVEEQEREIAKSEGDAFCGSQGLSKEAICEAYLNEDFSDDPDEEFSWEQMAEMGLVTETPDFPFADPEAELDEAYGKAAAKNFSGANNVQVPDAREPEMPIEDDDEEEENPLFRTRADLISANKELKKLLQNPGFNLCYKKAVVMNRNNAIYLVYRERRYQIASNAFTLTKKGIFSVMEGDI